MSAALVDAYWISVAEILTERGFPCVWTRTMRGETDDRLHTGWLRARRDDAPDVRVRLDDPHIWIVTPDAYNLIPAEAWPARTLQALGVPAPTVRAYRRTQRATFLGPKIAAWMVPHAEQHGRRVLAAVRHLAAMRQWRAAIIGALAERRIGNASIQPPLTALHRGSASVTLPEEHARLILHSNPPSVEIEVQRASPQVLEHIASALRDRDVQSAKHEVYRAAAVRPESETTNA